MKYSKSCCGDAYSCAISKYGDGDGNYDYDTYKYYFNEFAHNDRMESSSAHFYAMEEAKREWKRKHDIAY